jgi:dienelactone hydrolase
MHEQEIRVRTTDGEMRTFAVHPEGDDPFPVAVLYMDGIGYREVAGSIPARPTLESRLTSREPSRVVAPTDDKRRISNSHCG